MDAIAFWEESNTQDVQFDGYGTSNNCPDATPGYCGEDKNIYGCCNGNLNFATSATSEDEYNGFNRKKVSRDPMSHRIIEKRRRDRMNNCLADLSRLIPANYLKKGRGRVEKTEIIEMAIRHMKHLQAHAFRQLDSCDSSDQQQSPVDLCVEQSTTTPIVGEHYRLGYQECLSEVMHFLVEVEGFFAADPLCVQLINHLQKHCDNIIKGDRLNFPRAHQGETSSSSGSSYNHQQNGNNIPRGSSGSPDSSDSGRPDNKDQSLLGMMEEDDGGRSQLRDMLTSPSTLNGARYKFKNNIKQRFSAEADRQHVKRRRYEHLDLGRRCEQLDSNRRYEQQDLNGRYEQLNSNRRYEQQDLNGRYEQLNSINQCEQLDSNVRYEQLDPSRRCEQLDPHRRNSGTQSDPSFPASPKQQSMGVPIFALHSRGAFYIPLTLDSEMLTPHLETLTSGSRDVMLHPVTISVNFKQGQAVQLQSPPLDRQLTHSYYKTELDPFLTLPKWSACVPDGV